MLYIHSQEPQTSLPLRLIEPLAELHPHEVPHAACGLKLFEVDELKKKQLGYSRRANEESLCHAEKGSWLPGWIVIGYETGLGDPIFVDSERPELPVFTAMHGEAYWDPKPVAISLDAFGRCWSEFARIAKARGTPSEEPVNPLSEAEREFYLGRIREINESRIEAEIWECQLACGQDADS